MNTIYNSMNRTCQMKVDMSHITHTSPWRRSLDQVPVYLQSTKQLQLSVLATIDSKHATLNYSTKCHTKCKGTTCGAPTLSQWCMCTCQHHAACRQTNCLNTPPENITVHQTFPTRAKPTPGGLRSMVVEALAGFRHA